MTRLFWLPRTLLLICLIGSISNLIQAQICSETELFQKYWQYKDRFHKTFIVLDRDSSGCVNDGIGFDQTAQDTAGACVFTKQGYGIPATHLQFSPAGWGVPGGYVNQHHNGDTLSADYAFFDDDCISISWSNPAD